MEKTTFSHVTIGLPVYNGEVGLDRTISNLLNQSHRNLSLIICDNASTDGTRSICEKWQKIDSRVHYYRSDVNIGAAGNYERVLDVAESPYFMWAAHDDSWHEDFIQACLSHLENSPDFGFAMPLYCLRSTKWKLRRKIKPSILQHISSPKRSERVLTQLDTHASSHIYNLVYSLFRTDLIKNALNKCGITNDLLLTLVILNMSKGALVEKHLFFKQYPNLWPAFKRRRKMTFRKAQDFVYKRDRTTALLFGLFPEYREAIEWIQNHCMAANFLKDYKIVPIEEISQYFVGD